MYKKLLVFALMLGSVLSLKAQTQKGNQLVGGTIGISVGKQSDKNFYPLSSNIFYERDNKTTSFMIGPTYSYFIADNLDLGVSANYGHALSTYDYHYNYYIALDFVQLNPVLEKTITNAMAANIYLRKYILYKEKVGFRTGPFFQYGYNKLEYKYDRDVSNSSSKINSFSGGLNAEFVYFPTKHLGLSSQLARLDYSHQTSDSQNNKQTSSAFSFALVNSLQLTLSYVFGK